MGCGTSAASFGTTDMIVETRRQPVNAVQATSAVPTSAIVLRGPAPPSHRFQVGDTVKIIGNTSALHRLQQGHGGCSSQMLTAAGKTGRVVAVDADGDTKVEVEGRRWLFNPQCCSLERAAQPRQSTRGPSDPNQAGNGDGDADDERRNAAYQFGYMLGVLLADRQLEQEQLVRQAAEGNADNVRALLQRYPNQVNTKVSDLTALHVASYEGHRQVVELLLQAGAKSEITDNDGHTSLHYAVEGNEPIILEISLMKAPATVNCVDRFRRTALHSAAYKEFTECVKVLLKYNCDVNIQDIQGDTAMHDAFLKNNLLITAILVETKKINFQLKNLKGFNVIHMASLVGSHLVLSRMLTMAPRLVNEPIPTGSTALHLAAERGYPLTTKTLISVGRADLDIVNLQSHTALVSAIATGQLPIIELLVEEGANLEVEDSDGDTPLHIVIILMKNIRAATSLMGLLIKAVFEVQPKNITQAPKIYGLFRQLGGGQDVIQWLATACYLAARGADLRHKNRANVSSLDELAEHDNIAQLLLRCQKMEVMANETNGNSLLKGIAGSNKSKKAAIKQLGPAVYRLADKV